jgi:endonuclease YncB( thermonuclease family)
VRGALLAIIILAATAVASALLEEPLPELSGRIQASDGDSFRYGTERVRLLGLDAPELAQTCTSASGEWPCGRDARNRLAELLETTSLTCKPEDHDQYDRLLATCSSAEGDIGAILVAEGMAVSSGPYWREEGAARSARRGIWSGDFDQPRQWRNDHARPRGLLTWLGL